MTRHDFKITVINTSKIIEGKMETFNRELETIIMKRENQMSILKVKNINF